MYPSTLFGARKSKVPSTTRRKRKWAGGEGGQHQDQNFCEQKHRLKKKIKLLMLTSSIPLGCQDHLSNLLIKRRTVKLVVKFFPSRISILHLSLYWFPKHFLAYNVLLYTLLGVLPGPLASLSPPLVLSLHSTVADPDLQIKGGGGHPDPEIRGGPGLQKNFFRPFGPQFGLKIRGPDPSPGSATVVSILVSQ